MTKSRLGCKKVGSLFVVFALFLGTAQTNIVLGVEGLTTSSDLAQFGSEEGFFIVRGDLLNVPVKSMTRVSIVDPEIVDIVSSSDNELLLIAKTVGDTPIFIWDEKGKRIVMVRVVERDLETIKNRMGELFRATGLKGLKLEINQTEGKIILTGVLSESKKEDLDKVAEPFADYLVNLVKDEEVKDLIQIDGQMTALSMTLQKAMGISWTGAPSESGSFDLTYSEAVPNMDGSIGDFFKIGDFRRVTAINATVSALLSEGKARVLSQPKLVVVSGEEASILVGGQIPVLGSTTANTTTTTDITYKDYGVNMTITPTVTESDKIDIDLQINISDLDKDNAVGPNTAFFTETAQTKLLLNDQQTIILAGLIKHNENDNVARVPYVSNIPILGLLFRYREKPTKDQELVVSLTPKILEKNRKQPVIFDEEGLKEYKTKATYEQTIKAEGATKARPYYLGVPKSMTQYVSEVQRKISQAIDYPFEARGSGWEGTVKLGMLILKDGTLAYAVPQESSGYELFDQQATAIAKQMAPYPPFPEGTELQELNVTVPIVFSLKDKR